MKLYIEKLKIKGYKKFNNFTIHFKEHINVLVGENEAGKSTVLEAIDIVLNQRVFNYPGNFEKFFNKSNVDKFKQNPSRETLPIIEIEVYFNDDASHLDFEYFNGLHCFDREEKNGISFIYKFDDHYNEMLENLFNDIQEAPFIPTDYYSATWTTFSGRRYLSKKSPIKNILIDNSIRKNSIFDSYTKRIYNNNFDSDSKQSLSYNFRKSLESFTLENDSTLNINDYSFGLDENKTILENLLDLKSEGVSIQNKGKGKENLIKTEIALEAESELILLEEPENHLSHSNTRKLINYISELDETIQMIITTHNPLIVSRLDLRNTIWIQGDSNYSFNDLHKETADYFMKIDNINLLHYILSKKVILVEGNAEYILLPKLVVNSIKESLDNHKIEVISGGGITYKHYVELSKMISNNLLVVTDNDGSQETIDEIQKLNSKNIKIVCSSKVDEFTFEVCLFNKNAELLDDLASFKPRTTKKYKDNEYDKNLAYMLKNKTESALRLTEEDTYKDKTLLPDYIKEGIEWLIQQ